jgi:hypothetical protein
MSAAAATPISRESAARSASPSAWVYCSRRRLEQRAHAQATDLHRRIFGQIFDEARQPG